MIFDAIEQTYTIVNANFAADMAALVTAKSVTGTTTTATIEKRQTAEMFVNMQATAPTIGIWARGATTQAKVGGASPAGWRDAISSIVLDYYCTGTDPVAVAKQTELAAEALLLSVDRFVAGSTVYGAGELRNSITIELTDSYLKTRSDLFYRRAMITVPVTDRDTGI